MHTHWPRRHELGLYLLLAFVISWAAWPLVALNPQSSPLVPFGPLIAAVTVSLISGGIRALRGLVAQLGRWRCPARWYAIALLGPAAVTVAAAGLSVALGARPEGPALPDWSVIAGSFATTLVVVGLFEELGWLGYALPCCSAASTRWPRQSASASSGDSGTYRSCCPIRTVNDP